MAKYQKTEQMLKVLRENFTDEDYQNYIQGNVKMKDYYAKFNCTQNEMDCLFAERGYIKRTALTKNNIKADIFDNISTPESAYILGFYIADGCIHQNKFLISLNEKDVDILEKIRDYMSPITKLSYQKERMNSYGIITHPMYRFTLTCKRIVDKLEELGLGSHKTELPKSIKNIIPRELMWDFIRGYWDGDGCISSSTTKKEVLGKEYLHINTGFTIISKDSSILEELNEFFNSEGINTYVYPDKRGNFLVGTHSRSEIYKIYDKLYTNCNLFLARKRLKFNEIMETLRQADAQKHQSLQRVDIETDNSEYNISKSAQHPTNNIEDENVR